MLHDGRHTCATLLDNAEVNDKIVKLILGHKSKDITKRVYTHKTKQQLIEAINCI
ncbi:tyrosine-type recombinase/integrase [uncultured Megasphaera sp.]|uniref:tyrosine-type recombinase/integrase n=1 Tax=uncultured Megasphaera sp. TaxID=165188 RepID=UPI00349EAA12